MRIELSALAVLLATSSTSRTSRAQVIGDGPNIVYGPRWDDWVWCCEDSREYYPDGPSGCPDACAAINDPDLFAEWGPGSDNYIAESQDDSNTQPTMTLPPGGFTNVDEFVEIKCRMIHGFKCCREPCVAGDPHFKTWSGDFFDYQGQCELKLISAPDFGKGIGLDIHIRTKIKNSYSYIESAAVKIGNDVLEVGSWGEYFLNGVEQAQLPALMGGYPVAYYPRSEKEHIFDIFLGGDRRILIKNLKDWVSVHMDNPASYDFRTSYGMLGSFDTGAKLARDGQTILVDDNEYGQEWQVRLDEPQLFQKDDFEPLAPNQCILPVPEDGAEMQRRLAEAGVTQKQAEDACAHLPAHNKFCVRDVLATGDLDMANAN